jgi:tRNA threonylcarbamoyladenosine biosynthesis protein TsaE
MAESNDRTPAYRLVERFISRSSTETSDFGFRLAKSLQAGEVILFQGHLGSGKTTCIRGLCAGLAINELITSPTFTLINEYRGRLPVYHFDFYRICQFSELHDLGVEEYFQGEGVCLVEWPEVVFPLLPPSHRCLRFYHANEEAAAEFLNPAGRAVQNGEDVRLIEVYASARPWN